jgi:FSR family fosmidomycin resistance protein-like MFS transporter
VGGNVGVALGPLLGTAVVARLGAAGTTLLIWPGLAFAAALWWLLPRLMRPVGTPRLARRTAESRHDLPEDPLPDAAVARLGARRRGAAVAVLVAIVALRSTVSGALVSFVPLYFVRVLGADAATASRVLSGMLLVGALATLGGGYVADRWGRMRVLAGTLAAVPPLLALFVAAPPGSAGAVAALWAAGVMVTASFSVPVVMAQELWYERRALASGVIVGFAFGLGGLLVPVIGAAADRWGLDAALRLVAAIPLASLAFVAVLAALLRPVGASPRTHDLPVT